MTDLAYGVAVRFKAPLEAYYNDTEQGILRTSGHVVSEGDTGTWLTIVREGGEDGEDMHLVRVVVDERVLVVPCLRGWFEVVKEKRGG